MTMSETPTAKPSIWKRKWVLVTGVGVVAFVIGATAGSGGASGNAAALKTAKDKSVSLSSQLASVTSQVTQLRTTAAKATQNANSAVAVAQKHVDTEDSAVRDRLDARQAALNVRAHDLDAREAKVTGDEASFKKNTIPGDGEFLVGKEVTPGIYHAAASTGCYWARLSSLNTEDIIDNNNVDGPVTIEIGSSDKAFEAEGCAPFHKIG
jgi:hypothetical protein